MRFAVAMIVASLLAATIFFACLTLDRISQESGVPAAINTVFEPVFTCIRRHTPLRQGLSHQLNREILGDSPSNLTPESSVGAGVEVSPSTMLKLNIVDALLTLWWVWVPVLVVLCLGVATLFPTSQAKLNADEVQSGA